MSTVPRRSRTVWDGVFGWAVLALLGLAASMILGCGQWQENPVVAAERNTGSEVAETLDPMSAQGQDDANSADKKQKRRVPAPELKGGIDWLNTAGPLQLADLRG